MYPAHRAHIAFCVLPTFKTTGRTGISRSHIYSKGAPPPKTPGLQGARQRASDRWYAPPAACSLEHPRPLHVNPYSRRQAAVNQIIPYFPTGLRPWGSRPIFITAAPPRRVTTWPRPRPSGNGGGWPVPACRSSPVQIDVRGHHGWALPWSSPPAASPDGIPYVYLYGHPQYTAADEGADSWLSA